MMDTAELLESLPYLLQRRVDLQVHRAAHKCLIAEGWCPLVGRRRVTDALERATYQSSAQVSGRPGDTGEGASACV